MQSQTPDPSIHPAARRYDCPQCGAPVVFHSSISLSSVCEHCRSLVVRNDFQVATFGQMAELPNDLSPLKIGTKGYWNGRGFVLLGRLRLHYGDGSWNEWYADFGNGTYGWVAEVMGYYTLSFPQTVSLHGIDEHTSAGKMINIQGASWRIMDVKEARCIAAEGELPMIAPPGWSRLGMDLTGPGGQFGTIEIVNGERAFYSGDFAQFGDLNFTDLRKVPGWDADADITRRQSAAMNCPSCGAPVNLRAEGQTMSAVCGSCASILDATTPHLQEIGRVAKTTLQMKLALPIGSRGILKGEMWEVIGFMRRKDKWCSWEEYLLFNPWLGFRFLVSFRGHWSLVQILPGHYTNSVWNGESFKLFAREEVTTTDVLGEFYWRVKNGERATVSDHIAPPLVLSCEVMPGLNEVTWSGGEYIDHLEVQQAFLRDGSKLSPPAGPYLNEPNPHQQKWREVRGTFFLMLIGYCMVQFLFMGWGVEKNIGQVHTSYEATQAGQMITTPTFKVTGHRAPLHISAASVLAQDTYLGLKGKLIDAKTQTGQPVAFPLTNYSTAPGGHVQKVTLTGIAAGEYYLALTPDASTTLPSARITFTMQHGGLFWSNFWLGLAGIALWPVWTMLRSGSFEKRRWMESDFNPYATSDDD